MRKRLSWGAVLSLLIIVVAVTVCVTMLIAMRRFNSQVNELSNRQAMYDYVAGVDNAVRQNYYGTIDEEVLRRSMAAGEVAGIGDKYAAFLNNEEYIVWQEARSGQSTGFGLEVMTDADGQVVISTVQKGSTAYSAGLQKGDVVTALNKTPLGENAQETVETALQDSTSLILTVRRAEKETAFELSAAMFTRVCVDSEVLSNGTTGLIRIKSITDATPEQLKTAYNALKEQGVTELVLDLRNNSTGSPEAAKKIVSFLVPYGLYGYYTDKSGVTELRSEEAALLDMPAVVLVNQNTAGEAELIAGALKQAGVATLVGTRTAGRSLVQECFSLTTDNAAVCLSVGEFSLLDKAGWEGVGLTPDTEAQLDDAEQVKVLSLLSEQEDAQLQQALKTLSLAQNANSVPSVTEPTTTAPETDETAVETDETATETEPTAAE